MHKIVRARTVRGASPGPEAFLEAPVGAKRGGDPRHIARVLRERCSQLRRDQRLRNGPQEWQQAEAQQRQQRPPRADGILACGTLALWAQILHAKV